MKKANSNSKLTLFIFLGLLFGILFGWLFPEYGIKMQPLSDMFLRMVKMIIAPLIFATLVVGIAGHGDIKSLGKIGLKTIVYFEIVTTLALVLGLFIGNVTQPGKNFAIPEDMQIKQEQLVKEQNAAIEKVKTQNVQTQENKGNKEGKVADNQLDEVEKMQTQSHEIDHSLSKLIIDIIPVSVFDALAKGNLLQIVVFSIFFALAICGIGQKARPVLDFLQSTSEIMFKFTEYVMYFAPLGVFGAMAYTISKHGISILADYAKFIGIVYVSLAIFVILVLTIVCKIIKIPFGALIRAIKEPAILAFSTASSEAALPKAMDIMEKFGVPKNIVGFVMPTGYTFNLDGSTMYLALTALFCTQLVGIDLNFQQQLAIMITLMLTSKGIAAVPRVSLVVLTGTLASFHLPVIGVAVLLGIDQILDMGRTTVNLVGNCVATTVIARWENVFNFEKMNTFLESLNAPQTKKAREAQMVYIQEMAKNATSTGNQTEENPFATRDI